MAPFLTLPALFEVVSRERLSLYPNTRIFTGSFHRSELLGCAHAHDGFVSPLTCFTFLANVPRGRRPRGYRSAKTGVVNVAKACLSAKVPRLVVVSSGGVATPESAVYKFLNLFGEVR